jgi:hypothetical protein
MLDEGGSSRRPKGRLSNLEYGSSRVCGIRDLSWYYR